MLVFLKLVECRLGNLRTSEMENVKVRSAVKYQSKLTRKGMLLEEYLGP